MKKWKEATEENLPSIEKKLNKIFLKKKVERIEIIPPIEGKTEWSLLKGSDVTYDVRAEIRKMPKKSIFIKASKDSANTDKMFPNVLEKEINLGDKIHFNFIGNGITIKLYEQGQNNRTVKEYITMQISKIKTGS